MPRQKLNLDALAVESFDAAPPAAPVLNDAFATGSRCSAVDACPSARGCSVIAAC